MGAEHSLSGTGISSATQCDWEGHFNLVKTVEEACCINDGIMSDVRNRIIISNPVQEALSGDRIR